MSDLKQELWDWQESIDSPIAAKLLLVRAIARLNNLEKVAEAARKVLMAPVAPRGLAGFQVGPMAMHHLRVSVEALDADRGGGGGAE